MAKSVDCIENNRNEIYDECVRVVYKRRSQNLYSHIFVSVLPLYLGWGEAIWITNFLLLSLLWIYVLFGFYFCPSSSTSLLQNVKVKSWGKALYYQMVVLGIIYNLIFLNLAFSGTENAMVYLLLVTALFSAGAVGSYQNLKWLSVIFVFSAMTPQFIYYLTTAGVDGAIMAIAILIFIVFMSNIGLQLHKDAITTLALNHELITANEKLDQLARTDVLTGMNNRRSFFEMGKIILTNAKRHEHSLSVVMLDIDNFKFINDTYGHAIGDAVLKAVANTLNQGVRDSDFTGRVGGEEFAVILQETNLTSAQELIERLRAAIQLTNIHIESQDISVTASFGIAQFEAENDDFEKLLSRADVALYQAKESGRNQVVINEEHGRLG